MTQIEWHPVPGYEGRYEVSSDGQVKSLPRISIRGQRVKGCIRKPKINPSGYPTVSISRDGERRRYEIHALVALAFLGPRPEGMEVRHLDGDKLNNTLANLAYGTSSENALDAVRHGTHNNTVKTHCPAGHPYAGDNLFVHRGRRECWECRREAARRYRQRQRELRAQAVAS